MVRRAEYETAAGCMVAAGELAREYENELYATLATARGHALAGPDPICPASGLRTRAGGESRGT